MKKLILVSIILISFSCVSQKDVIKRSTIKLEGKSTNIRDLIEIDGYYPLPGSLEATNSEGDRNIGCIMFFDDGSWTYFHFQDVSNEEKRSNMSKFVSSYTNKKQLRWGDWGVYSIKNDTIIVHFYTEPALLTALSMSESRYKILDRKTIQRVYFKASLDDDYYKIHSPWRNEEPIHFTPADSIPSPNSWLKEKKWIWRNEADWKAYMEKIKQEK